MYFKLHVFIWKRGRHEVNDVRQTEIQTTKPLLPQPKVFEIEMDTKELNTQNSPGTDKIPTQLIQAGGKAVHYDTH